MAIGPMKAVWEYSRTTDNARMILTLIANDCNEEGWGAFPKQKTLAHRAGGISERAVQRAIATAVDLGELEVHRPSRDAGNHYSVMLPGLAILEDEQERERREEAYEEVALGRAEKARRKRANRRSVDTTPASAPSDGGTRRQRQVPPDASVGTHPTPASGHIKEHPLVTHQLPRESAQARDLSQLLEDSRRRLGEVWPIVRNREVNFGRVRHALESVLGRAEDPDAQAEILIAAASRYVDAGEFDSAATGCFSLHKWLDGRHYADPVKGAPPPPAEPSIYDSTYVNPEARSAA